MATLRLHTCSDTVKTTISRSSDGFTSLKLPLGRRHLKLVGLHERFAEAFGAFLSRGDSQKLRTTPGQVIPLPMRLQSEPTWYSAGARRETTCGR